jgi:hypothetical protein
MWLPKQFELRKRSISDTFGICVEKGSELPKGDKGRKFKGRVVFQVRANQNWKAALSLVGFGEPPPDASKG